MTNTARIGNILSALEISEGIDSLERIVARHAALEAEGMTALERIIARHS